MKKSFFIVTGLIFAVSTAFASPSDQMDFTTMSKADSQVLFGHNDQDTLTLEFDEMKNTEGEAIWFAPFAWSAVRVAVTGFTRHGLNQAINRGSTRAISYTLNNSRRAYSDIARKTTRYESSRGVVILNQNGRVVSNWRWSR